MRAPPVHVSAFLYFHFMTLQKDLSFTGGRLLAIYMFDTIKEFHCHPCLTYVYTIVRLNGKHPCFLSSRFEVEI